MVMNEIKNPRQPPRTCHRDIHNPASCAKPKKIKDGADDTWWQQQTAAAAGLEKSAKIKMATAGNNHDD